MLNNFFNQKFIDLNLHNILFTFTPLEHTNKYMPKKCKTPCTLNQKKKKKILLFLTARNFFQKAFQL